MVNDIIQNQLLNRKYNPEKPPPPEQVVFTIQEKVIGTIENYVVFSGAAKAGKSTFLTSAIASALVPHFQDVFGIKIKPIPDRNKIVFFDTESSSYDFHRVINRIKHFAMLDKLPDNFEAYSLREDNPKAIRQMIRYYLENNPDCSIVIIDGFLDLVMNYNDEIETRRLTNWLKKLTKKHQILIIGVLHISKGTGNTLGHLGSNTDRWAQSTLIIEKEESTKQIVLKPKLLRSADTFNPIALMNFQGNWNQFEYMHPEPEIKKAGKKPA